MRLRDYDVVPVFLGMALGVGLVGGRLRDLFFDLSLLGLPGLGLLPAENKFRLLPKPDNDSAHEVFLGVGMVRPNCDCLCNRMTTLTKAIAILHLHKQTQNPKGERRKEQGERSKEAQKFGDDQRMT